MIFSCFAQNLHVSHLIRTEVKKVVLHDTNYSSLHRISFWFGSLNDAIETTQEFRSDGSWNISRVIKPA